MNNGIEIECPMWPFLVLALLGAICGAAVTATLYQSWTPTAMLASMACAEVPLVKAEPGPTRRRP